VKALTIMQTLGLMAAAHLVVPLGLLTRLQRWFAGLRLDPKRHKQRLVKVYAAASCHERFDGRSEFSQPLMTRFLLGVRRQRPVVHASSPQWDLPLMLEALVTEPFEPLGLSSPVGI